MRKKGRRRRDMSLGGERSDGTGGMRIGPGGRGGGGKEDRRWEEAGCRVLACLLCAHLWSSVRPTPGDQPGGGVSLACEGLGGALWDGVLVKEALSSHTGKRAGAGEGLAAVLGGAGKLWVLFLSVFVCVCVCVCVCLAHRRNKYFFF